MLHRLLLTNRVSFSTYQVRSMYQHTFWIVCALKLPLTPIRVYREKRDPAGDRPTFSRKKHFGALRLPRRAKNNTCLFRKINENWGVRTTNAGWRQSSEHMYGFLSSYQIIVKKTKEHVVGRHKNL